MVMAQIHRPDLSLSWLVVNSCVSLEQEPDSLLALIQTDSLPEKTRRIEEVRISPIPPTPNNPSGSPESFFSGIFHSAQKVTISTSLGTGNGSRSDN